NNLPAWDLWEDNIEKFNKAPGSTNNHQAWEGGYMDHICEAMNTACALYSALNSRRPLPFTLGDALLCLYLHDIEKPWKYVLGQDELEDPDLATKEKRHEFRGKII